MFSTVCFCNIGRSTTPALGSSRPPSSHQGWSHSTSTSIDLAENEVNLLFISWRGASNPLLFLSNFDKEKYNT